MYAARALHSESMLMKIDEGLIACPICAKRMKEEEVFSHLDVHNETPDRGEMGGKNAVMR